MLIPGNAIPIIGLKTATELDLLKVGGEVNSVMDTKDILKKYESVFVGIGKLKNYQLRLNINQEVNPVAQPTRRVPFHLREKTTQKIKELEQEGIIERVEGPTEWVSPLVVAPKRNGDVRICIDMREANTAVIRERHPIPTVDEVLEELKDSTLFSRLDLRWGFHQIELDETSRYITTFFDS